MIFSLEVRRARKGDCLLLHFGSAAKPGLAIVDGGPSGVYGPHLKPRLLEIRKARGLDKSKPLPVDVLMISHVDDDHINGILDLTREMIEATGAPLVAPASLWHNSFDEIIGNNPKELTAAVTAQFGAASLSGGLPSGATVDADGLDQETAVSTFKVLASIEQGYRLRRDAEKLGIPRNPEFDGKLVLAGKEEHTVAKGLTFTVAGPMKPELLALQEKHDDWLADLKKKHKSPDAALAAYVDESVPNLSSIVVLAKSGSKRILLTGDARGDKILEGLELVKVLKPGAAMHVDVLKVPHHGSANNLDVDFFQRITADHYVFSGDGEFGNPEREALDMLFKARGSKPFQIHLTYPIDEIDVARKAEWEKKPRKTKWSAAKQGLTAFFKNTKLATGQKIQIVDATKSHVIDLLDPLGF